MRGDVAPRPAVPRGKPGGDATPRILIVRLGALGDVIHALPALRRLRRSLPGARIEWVVEAPHAPVLAHHPDLDRVHLVRTGRWRRELHHASTWREIAAAVRTLRGERFDLAVDLQGLAKSAVLARLSGAPIRVGHAPGRTRERLAALLVNRRAPVPAGPHVVDAGLAAADAAVRALGGEPAPACPEVEERGLVHLADEERGWADETLARAGLGPFLVLNPGAAWITKRWPAERFGEVARTLAAETGHAVFVSHGPGEEALAARLLESAAHARVVTFPTTIRELAALLSRARLLVGGDTGPYHLAWALGVPTIGLFGPTDPGRNGSRAGDPMLWGRTACSPCYGRTCPTHIECMSSIEVRAVLRAARDCLLRSSPGGG